VLFELILRLHLLVMQHGLILHITHIAGTQMMQQGTDGLSRGDVSGGVMADQDMHLFIPLHFTTLDRAPSLLPWLQSWLPIDSIHPLTPEEWFERGHGLQGGCKNSDGIWIPLDSDEIWFLWAPAPATVAAAL